VFALILAREAAMPHAASTIRIIVVMGVSGSGKTTVGQLVATRLGDVFVDADQLHTPANVAKMQQGIPLDDADREPWLEAIEATIQRHRGAGHGLVVACSALKASYRDRLGGGDVAFPFLSGDHDLLRERLAARKGHFFDPHLLDSQLATLEEPAGADTYRADIRQPPAHIVDAFLAWLAHR
jgi:gluconokinase